MHSLIARWVTGETSQVDKQMKGQGQTLDLDMPKISVVECRPDIQNLLDFHPLSDTLRIA